MVINSVCAIAFNQMQCFQLWYGYLCLVKNELLCVVEMMARVATLPRAIKHEWSGDVVYSCQYIEKISIQFTNLTISWLFVILNQHPCD